jgi:hypothetical protein
MLGNGQLAVTSPQPFSSTPTSAALRSNNISLSHIPGIGPTSFSFFLLGLARPKAWAASWGNGCPRRMASSTLRWKRRRT